MHRHSETVGGLKASALSLENETGTLPKQLSLTKESATSLARVAMSYPIRQHKSHDNQKIYGPATLFSASE